MKFRKRKFNLDEINAYRIAYGEPIKVKDVFKSVFLPFVMCFIFVFLLFFKWWLGLIAGIVGVLYSFLYIMPTNEKREYELKSFKERNKFVNNMTQILTNEERTVLQAISIVTERATGEFKEDLIALQTDLVDASEGKIQDAFKVLEEKYETDVMFSQFIEQLTTAMLEGRSNLDTLKDIKTYHNMIKDKQTSFFISKQQKQRDFNFMVRVALIFIVFIIFSFGINQYLDYFANNIIGWIVSGVYLLLIANIYHSFRVRLSDDSVMEVKL